MGASTVARAVTLLGIAGHRRRWTEVAADRRSDALDPEKTHTEAGLGAAEAMAALPPVGEVVDSMVRAEKEAAAGAVVPLPDMVAVGVGEVALADDCA